MALREYKRKRNFSKTPEPPGKVSPGKQGKPQMFVVQKHAARRLHYDLRLELEGVLKSWAVPKGFPTKRGERRLAIHVEDHPMDYATFEGIIAEGNYGAGTVMVWDQGTYSSPAGDPLKALNQGKLPVTFNGKKLKGDWTLVRMRRSDSDDGKDEWLIIKSGEDTKPISERADNTSVLSKRSMEQIRKAADAEWKSNRPNSSTPTRERTRKKNNPGKRDAQLLDRCPRAKADFVPPMKARLVSTAPSGEEWRYEIKLDGYRAIGVKQGKQIKLYSRNHLPLNDEYPGLPEAVRELAPNAFTLDGEIIALDESGRSSFQLLQNAAGDDKVPIRYYVFDLLNLENRDLRGLTLLERKQLLESVLGETTGPVRYLSAIEADPSALLAEIKRKGFEGIIAKRRDSVYETGVRSKVWLKIKCVNEQEFVIGGYTEPQGGRKYFGAVLVGYYQDKKLLFAAKVGTGFNDKMLRTLHQQFQPLRQAECPFANLPAPRAKRYGQALTASEMKHCTWVKPKLVCQVKFTEWTGDGSLRHPVFLGLREDKKASEVTRETPVTP